MITRRSFLKTTGITVATFSTLAIASEPSQKKQNCLLILTDEHNFRTLGCYRELLTKEQALMWGEAVVDTPHIDWIAHNGAIFNKMYASSPVCSPCRSSMFTGCYPQTAHVNRNGRVMSTEIPTIADVLSKQGYKTGYAGKWHLSGEDKPGWILGPCYGFQDNRYMYNRGHWKHFSFGKDGRPVVRTENDIRGKELKELTEKTFSTDWLTDRTIEFIDKNKTNAFFYVVSYPDPHGPDIVREPYASQYAKIKFADPRTFATDKKQGNPSWSQPTVKKNKNMADYYGMVKCIDDNVGRLLDKLRQDNLLDSTVVVFGSDHGDMCGEHGRENKGVPQEASARIPFVVYAEAAIKKGTVVNATANTTDWMKTILTLMNISEQPAVEGRDLTCLLNATVPADWNDVTFMRIEHVGGGWVAAVSPRHKLILSNDGDKPWLMDLEKDPDELANFVDSKEHSSVLKKLAAELEAYGQRTKDPLLDNSKIKVDLELLLSRES